MRRLLARALLVLMLLIAGGVVVAEDHAAGRGTALSSFSLHNRPEVDTRAAPDVRITMASIAPTNPPLLRRRRS